MGEGICEEKRKRTNNSSKMSLYLSSRPVEKVFEVNVKYKESEEKISINKTLPVKEALSQLKVKLKVGEEINDENIR